MKNIFLIVFSFLIVSSVNLSFSQDISIAIDYLHGEKSKDSHSMEESYALSNSSVIYSVKYSGHKDKNQHDMDKICSVTKQDMKNIRQTIEAKNLNVNDSLESTLSKTKNYEIYTRINIAINMDGQEYKININGDTKEFEDAELYKNAEYFIAMLRKMVEDCK